MRVLAALVLVLLAVAPARADTFGDLPFRPVAGVATCVRATGVPGEIARWSKGGMELLRADAGGLTPTGTVTLGGALSCPELAGQADGAAVAAVFVRGGVRVALRDPGARFAAPSALPLRRDGEYDHLAAAVSPRGDAVVAVLESGGGRSRVLAFRRAAGGVFGAAEQVAAWRGNDLFGQGLAAGVDGEGRVTLAWARQVTSIRAAIETASAATGQAFGSPSRAGTTQGSEPSLAIAADGRALLAFDGVETGVNVVEREPGAARFGAPAVLAGAGTFDAITLVLADGGAAAVAWRPDELYTSNGVRVSTRSGPGAFGSPRDAAPGYRRRGSGLVAYATGDAAPDDRAQLAAAIAGANVVLAWADQPDDGGTGVAQAATGALAGGAIVRAAVGGPVRPAISLASLALADGRAAVAWADDAVELASFPTGQGRLHLAIAGAARAADAPPPAVSVPRLKRRRRYIDDPIVLPVRCSAACDVRAVTQAGRVPGFRVTGRASAGLLTLRIYGFQLLRARPTQVGVTLRWSAPGSRRTATREVRVPVRVLRSPPLPAPLDVRARRSGGDVIVTWRASFAARRGVFLVSAQRGRDDAVATRGVRARGRRSFRVTLRDAGAARTVTVSAYGASDQKPREKTVHIR